MISDNNEVDLFCCTRPKNRVRVETVVLIDTSNPKYEGFLATYRAWKEARQ